MQQLSAPHTFCLSFIEGDSDGLLTQLVIEQLSSKTALVYSPSEAHYQISIRLTEVKTRNVNFRYERNRKGRLEDNIIPTETCLSALVLLQMTDLTTGKALFAPVVVGSHVDFDHTYYSSRGPVNIFSLGQLTDYDEAKDAAWGPLAVAIAEDLARCLQAIFL